MPRERRLFERVQIRSLACALLLTAALAPAAAPVAADGPGTHTVQDGETLWQIADAAGTDATTLAQLNGLDDPSLLKVGQTLKLPAAASSNGSGPSSSTTQAAPTASSASAATSSAAATSSGAAPTKRSVLASYTVQPGQTLNQIARQLDVGADAIVQASGLDDPNHIAVGTVLKVPVPGREHVVQSGETLSDIAAQEKVDLGSLVDFNAIDDPALIRPGQVVLVPVAPNLQAAAVATASQSAANATATPAPMAASTPAPSTPAPSTPQGTRAAATPATAPSSPSPSVTSAVPAPAPGAARPAVVVPAPPGAPTDGLAGLSLKLLGDPYVWGGSSPSGFDCSGFVWYVARQANKSISRGLLGQYNSGSHPGRDELKPGDLVFFQNTYSNGLSHNGVYIGNGQFVHAADEAAGVTISSLGTAYWSSHWFGATRLS